MGIEISVIEDLQILEVRYLPEEVTAEDMAQQRVQVADAMARHAIGKVLVDASALNRLPPILAMYEHNAAVSAQETLRKAKFAVVCTSLGEDEQFLENSGMNRGVRIKCVTTREEGLAWLIG